MRLWIDCEWDGYKGPLLSMALVAENGDVFYEALDVVIFNPWVKEHVVPVLHREPVSLGEFKNRLRKFLLQYSSLHVIADWPEDVAWFCEAIVTGAGQRMPYGHLSFEVALVDAVSAVPHNALQDALAFKEACLLLETKQNG